jgi:apolipoprotein N-acyltransferase
MSVSTNLAARVKGAIGSDKESNMLVAERKESRVIADTQPSTQPASVPVKAKQAGTTIAPALLTGALLWASHFPLAWGWLGWFSLVPILTLTRVEASARRIYWSTYLGGLAFFLPALQWMRVADARMYATWLMLAFYCAAYFPLALWLIRRLDRRGVPMTLSVPLVWVGLEWVRSFVLTGFAWYFLGHAQFRFASLIQIADLGGVYLISFIVAAVNGWLTDLAFHIPTLRDRFRWREVAIDNVGQASQSLATLGIHGGLAAGLVIGAVFYGTWRLEAPAFFRGPRVALLQTDVPQSVRNGEQERTVMEVQNRLLPLVACAAEPLVDLVIWPETSFHFPHLDLSKCKIDRIEPKTVEHAGDLAMYLREGLAARYPARHLLGVNTYSLNEDGKEIRYSSALLVDDRGVPAGRFDKIHRVPFGEYTPFRDWLPFMRYLAPYGPDHDYDIRPGERMTRFPLRDFSFGALICFEDSDAALARKYAQDGPDGKPVDFLVNISNDGWFGDTCEHEEHLVVSLFRAIENRRSMVRACNQGISAVIDGNGRILKPSPAAIDAPDPDHPSPNPKVARAQGAWEAMGLWHELNARKKAKDGQAVHAWNVLPDGMTGDFAELPPSEFAAYKNNCGVLFATVPIDRRSSVYAQWGDWLPIGCWGLILTIMAAPLIFGRRRTARG